MNRKNFFRILGTSALGLTTIGFSPYQSDQETDKKTNQKGNQRLSVEELEKWQDLKYGM